MRFIASKSRGFRQDHLAGSTASSCVLFSAEKVQRDVRLIANDPAVVWRRWNVKEFARFQLNYATILEHNCRSSRKNESHVFNRTARRANSGADVLAPFPPGLICRATNCESAKVDQLEFAFLHQPHFIRLLERFKNDSYLLAVHLLFNSETCFLKSKATFRIHCDHL